MTRSTFLVLALVLGTTTAHAELAPAAKVRLDAGLARYSAGQYESAIVEFEAAFEIDPEPSLLFTWAQAERLAGHCDQAVPRYRRFIASKPSQAAIDLANNGISLCESQRTGGGGPPPPPPPPPRSERGGLPWYKNPAGGAVIGGVACLGVSVGFFLASNGNRDRADHATTSDVFDDYLDVATTQRRIGVTFLVVGAGLLGGGIGYHLYTRSSSRTVVGTTGTSLYIAGAF